MSSFKMNLNLDAYFTRDLFNVSENRAREIGDLIDRIGQDHPEWGLNRLLEKLSEHSLSENENRYVVAALFQDAGIQMGIHIGHESQLCMYGFFERSDKNSKISDQNLVVRTINSQPHLN